MTSEVKTVKTLRLKPEMIAQLEELAAKENRTFTNMVETLIKKAMKSA